MIQAWASFAYLQWIQLEWETPFAVIPMIDQDSMKIGKEFASLMEAPFIRAFDSRGRYKEARLEEEKTLLLFDVSNSVEDLSQAVFSLSESFPKRIYLLSLLPYVAFDP